MTAEISREYSEEFEDDSTASPVQEKLTLDDPILVHCEQDLAEPSANILGALMLRGCRRGDTSYTGKGKEKDVMVSFEGLNKARSGAAHTCPYRPYCGQCRLRKRSEERYCDVM